MRRHASGKGVTIVEILYEVVIHIIADVNEESKRTR